MGPAGAGARSKGGKGRKGGAERVLTEEEEGFLRRAGCGTSMLAGSPGLGHQIRAPDCRWHHRDGENARPRLLGQMAGGKVGLYSFLNFCGRYVLHLTVPFDAPRHAPLESRRALSLRSSGPSLAVPCLRGVPQVMFLEEEKAALPGIIQQEWQEPRRKLLSSTSPRGAPPAASRSRTTRSLHASRPRGSTFSRLQKPPRNHHGQGTVLYMPK